MELNKIGRRIGLGTLAVILLGALWLRVRAAQAQRYNPEHFLSVPRSLGASSEVLRASMGRLSSADANTGEVYQKAAAMTPSVVERADSGGQQEYRTPVPEHTPRKIVRNASASIEVKDYVKARRLILESASKRGADVERDDAYENGGVKGGILSLRTTPEKFDALLNDLEPIGRLLGRSVSSQNMTEEYVDLRSRLENMRKVEKRLTELLSFQTHRLTDVLQVEKEIERVGGDIERIQGRMKYIDSLSAQSVLTLTLSEPSRETSQAPGIFNRVANSLTRTINTFVTTGLALLDFSGFLLAVGLWVAPVGGLAWFVGRKMKTRNSQDS